MTSLLSRKQIWRKVRTPSQKKRDGDINNNGEKPSELNKIQCKENEEILNDNEYDRRICNDDSSCDTSATKELSLATTMLNEESNSCGSLITLATTMLNEENNSCGSLITSTGSGESISTKSTVNNVRFSSKIRVCLVPCRNELKTHADSLFWTQDEYSNFKQEAIHEIKQVLINTENCPKYRMVIAV